MNKEAIIQDLNALGSTPTAIAKSLEDLAIRGKSRVGEQCPLAVYLKKQGHNVMIGYASVVSMNMNDPMALLELPKPCFEFREAFDHGEFPNLKEEP